MGMRRRTRRRGLIAGAAIGAGVAHHHANKQQDQVDDQAPADDEQDETQSAPPPPDPADQVEHLAKLHESGALTDEEFAAAKAKALGHLKAPRFRNVETIHDC